MAEYEPQPNPTKPENISFRQLRQSFQNIGIKVIKRAIQSIDYVAGVSGWYIGAEGDIEFSDGTFRGTIVASAGSIGGTDISSTALTGGIIQTASAGDRLVMTEDSFASNNNPAIDCYENNLCVGSLRPQIGTAGKGLIMEAYKWSDGSEAASIGVVFADDLGISGGEYASLEIYLFSGLVFGAYRDQSFSNINYLSFNSRISGNINPPTGTGTANGDIGRSDSTWDNMWVEDINYQTLSDFSDERLKENIKDIKLGLADILKLRAVSFDWKKGKKKGDFGFIAQEVQSIIPSMVKEAQQKEIEYDEKEVEIKDEKGKKKKIKVRGEGKVSFHKILPSGAKSSDSGLLMLEMNKLFPILVKSIQELNEKIEVLEEKLKVNKK